jgi:hypothetical protein
VWHGDGVQRIGQAREFGIATSKENFGGHVEFAARSVSGTGSRLETGPLNLRGTKHVNHQVTITQDSPAGILSRNVVLRLSRLSAMAWIGDRNFGAGSPLGGEALRGKLGEVLLGKVHGRSQRFRFGTKAARTGKGNRTSRRPRPSATGESA